MTQVQQQEQVQEPIQQAPKRVKKKWGIKEYINSPYILLLIPLLVGGFFLVLNPQYVTLAMNYPFAAAFILAIPVALFIIKLVINFFSVIEQWVRLQFEKARNAKRGQFLEFVIAVFMFVSVTEAGPMFNKLQGYALGGALGYITVFAFDLVAVVCMKSRAKMLRKGHDGKAHIYQLGVWLCALVSVFANLYEAIQNATALSTRNPLTFFAPLAGIAFPVMIIFLSYATDADEDDVDDPEVYRTEQEKRVAFVKAKREIAEAILQEKIQMNLLKGREFFLRGWFFTKKKMNAVIEVATQQVMDNIKKDVDKLKQSILDEVNGLRQKVVDEITATVTKKVVSSTQIQVNTLQSENAKLKDQLQKIQADREDEKREFNRRIEQLQTLIVSQIEQQNNLVDRQLYGLQTELESRFNGVIDSAVLRSIEAAQEVVKDASMQMSQEPTQQAVKRERNTDEMAAIAPSQQSSGWLADPELQDVLIHYPILKQWLTRGVKSLTLEEIVETTNHSRKMVINRIKDGTFAKTKNPNRFRMDSILTWLKTAPLPKRQEGVNSEGIETPYSQNESVVNESDNAGQEAFEGDNCSEYVGELEVVA
jgi:hypothetical protein